MFDREGYMAQVEDIRTSKLMSKTDIAREMKVSYATLMRLLDKEIVHEFSYVTLKKLRMFVDKYK